jgi:hemoglobin-like flavoprotein
MTGEQIRLVRVTWLEVASIADTAARLFYGRLFETDPEVRQLFAHSDMDQQREKLLRTLTVAVGALDKLETIRPALENLGRRHVGYGVEDRHYDLVGAALLWALEQGLGDGYTPAVREAWTAAYTTLAAIMREAAATVERAA